MDEFARGVLVAMIGIPLGAAPALLFLYFVLDPILERFTGISVFERSARLEQRRKARKRQASNRDQTTRGGAPWLSRKSG